MKYPYRCWLGLILICLVLSGVITWQTLPG